MIRIKTKEYPRCSSKGVLSYNSKMFCEDYELEFDENDINLHGKENNLATEEKTDILKTF